MDVIKLVLDVALNLEHYLGEVIKHYGALTYAILFVIVFIETVLVIVPFLPGDSLLFDAGAFAHWGHLDPYLLFRRADGGHLARGHGQLLDRTSVGKRAARSRWISRASGGPTPSSRGTAARRSSSLALCRSCARERRSWPA
jgi:membrane-associated protein